MTYEPQYTPREPTDGEHETWHPLDLIGKIHATKGALAKLLSIMPVHSKDSLHRCPCGVAGNRYAGGVYCDECIFEIRMRNREDNRG